MKCLFVEHDGPPVGDTSTARELVERAMNDGARVIAVPVERLDPAFLQLRSGLAGEFMQKVLNYRMQLAIVGDISRQIANSAALRDFVIECNRGNDILFVEDAASLSERLNATERRHE